MILSVADLPVEGKRVFVRVDFNVPLTPAGGVADDSRIRASLPTIESLIGRGARVILASHLGRPKGPSKALSLEPVGVKLAELLAPLRKEVRLTDEPVGDGARKVVGDLRDGEVALLENLRFDPGEEKNDEQFAKALASYADVYVNDAFGTAHRAHASTVGMIRFVAYKGAGFLMLKEIAFLSKLLDKVERPYVAILGGAKVSDKIGVLEHLTGLVDTFLIGGAMANTFLKANGGDLGRSLVQDDKLTVARNFLKNVQAGRGQVLLPVDVVAAGGVDASADEARVVPAVQVPADLQALDIGPETRRLFAEKIAGAKTVFWNGPMGVFEKRPFAGGTFAVAQAVAACQGLTVVGGGDSVAAIDEAGVAGRITHISTGGGASLEFIEGRTLPGIAALSAPSRGPLPLPGDPA
jgi:phosphoglycerate kinase